MSPREAAACCRPLDALLSVDVFKALADGTRLRLVACLTKCARPATVGEVAACCAVDLSVVSRHLRQLERAGVVQSERSGRTVFYAIDHRALAGRFRALADAIRACSPDGGAASEKKG